MGEGRKSVDASSSDPDSDRGLFTERTRNDGNWPLAVTEAQAPARPAEELEVSALMPGAPHAGERIAEPNMHMYIYMHICLYDLILDDE